MIDQKTVYAILSDSSLNQTRAQVEALLEKELQKPENEMDAALVEEYVLTLAEMEGADYKPLVPAQPPLPAAGAKRKRRNRSRWLRYSLAAACLCAFMLLVASATGKYVQPSIPAVTAASSATGMSAVPAVITATDRLCSIVSSPSDSISLTAMIRAVS